MVKDDAFKGCTNLDSLSVGNQVGEVKGNTFVQNICVLMQFYIEITCNI